MIERRISPSGSLLLGVAAAISLIVVPTAAANTNLIPNPGFETNCSGVPCNWAATSGATISRDTTQALASSASMKMTMTGSLSVAGAGSACVTTAIGAGTHDASLWYLASDPLVASVELAVAFYSGANCTGIQTIRGGSTQTIDDGGWHALQLKVVSPAAASVLFVVNMTTFNFPQTPSVYIDNLDFESEVTAVTLASASATGTAKGVLVHWRTGTEADLLGFQVYRSRGHSWQRITRSLVVAKGSVAGASYHFLDRTARRGVSYRYRIKAVNRDGTTTWSRPVGVT